MNMKDINISLMEINDLQKSAKVLSIAMLDNPLHCAVFKGRGEKERLEIEKMFENLFLRLPGIVFLAKEKDNIVGVMRMKSCRGSKANDGPKKSKDKNDIGWRKSVWHAEWARHDPLEQHWHLGPIGVLPSHQGSGVGSLLMERFCREVDACSAKAYLETEGDKNRRFYQKFGFDFISKSIIFEVENLYMKRVSHT
jgi:GNAT superfamily N-acetyltransferase